MLLLTGNGIDETIAVELSPEDRAKLAAFSKAVRRIQSLEALSNRPRYMAIHAPPQGPAHIESRGPSSEQLDALMHRLRPLLLHREPASFNRVVALLGRHLRHPSIRLVLKMERARYEGEVWSSLIRIKSGDEVLNTDQIFRRYLNAFEYHGDEAKCESMDELLRRTVPGLMPWVFGKMVFEKVQAIENIAELARVVAGEQAAVEFNGFRLENRAA